MKLRYVKGNYHVCMGMYVLCDKGIYPGCRVVKKFMCFCVLGDDKEKFFNFRSRGDYKRAVLTAAVTLNAKVCNLDVQMTKDDEKKEKSGEVEVTGKRKEPQKKSKFRGRKEFDEKTGKGEEDGAETYFGYHMSKFNPETDFLKDCIKKIYNVNRKKKDDDTRYYTQPNCSYLEQYENLPTGFHPAPRNHEGIVIEPTIGHVIYDMMRLQPTATEIPAGTELSGPLMEKGPMQGWFPAPPHVRVIQIGDHSYESIGFMLSLTL